MAYTICNLYGDPKPLRIITPDANEVPTLRSEFTPSWWTCDPCNKPSERYEVTYRSDQEKPQTFHWYEVVTSDDSPADIEAKINHYTKIIAARKAVEEAERELRRLS